MSLKKMVSIALASLMALTAFSGCSQKASQGSSESGGIYKGTLTLCTWDSAKTQYLKDTQAAYQKLHPDVTLKMLDITASDYIDKVTVMLAGGDTTDVIDFKSLPQMGTLVSQGRMEKLDPYISKAKFDMTPYNEMEEGLKVNNSVYSLPFRDDVWVLYYNKDLFDKAGVTYPTNDMTWDQYRDTAKKLTSGSGASKVYGAYTHTWAEAVQDWWVADGKGSLTDGKYDGLKSYYEFFLGMQNEDGSMMSYATVKAAGSNYLGYFTNQQIAMIPMGSWMASNLIYNFNTGNYKTFKWGMVNVPHSPGTKAGSTVGAPTGDGINVNAKNKALAWDFIQWRSSEDGALVHAQSGQMPALRTDKVMKALSEVKGMPADENSMAALKPGKVYPNLPYDQYGAQINQILTEENELIMTGSVSVDKGIADMTSRVAAAKAGK